MLKTVRTNNISSRFFWRSAAALTLFTLGIACQSAWIAEGLAQEAVGEEIPVTAPASPSVPADAGGKSSGVAAQDAATNNPQHQKNPSAPSGATPAVAPGAPPVTPPAKPRAMNAVRIQGLNKVTARNSMVTAPLGEVVRFDNLEIIAKKCWQSPVQERPEDSALLEIRELKPDEAPHTVFYGWMFSSSPALSALEHPVYDITVLHCESVDNTGE